MKPRQTANVRLEHILVGDRRRQVSKEAVEQLARSLDAIGLRTPITVRVVMQSDVDDGTGAADLVLVTGATRLAAARSLGWQEIEAFVVDDCDEVQAELWEIAENLHRAELTALERDEQVARWIELTERKLIVSDRLSETRGGRPGVSSAAASELGVNAKDAQRAVKVAALSPEAKDAARAAGLENNRSALLAAASQPEPAAQVAKVHDIAASRTVKSVAQKTSPLNTLWSTSTMAAKAAFVEANISEIRGLIAGMEQRNRVAGE